MLKIYLTEGIRHITDIQAYDHMAYLLALTAGFTFNRIKPLLLLVTAFTLGHTFTLILSAVNEPILPSSTIEFLIPVTILITALYQLSRPITSSKSIDGKIYLVTFLFGLIHGSGFSNYFKALMGKSTNIIEPLLAFNLGVEIGQLIIVSILLLLTYLATSIIKIKLSQWKTILTILAIAISIYLTIKTWPF
ncbi:MAG: HupE/UreJ family protein [Saprospiraceae bacterium]|nr:HupE/UreJ family protein [Saprospiraceae bacterium]